MNLQQWLLLVYLCQILIAIADPLPERFHSWLAIATWHVAMQHLCSFNSLSS